MKTKKKLLKTNSKKKIELKSFSELEELHRLIKKINKKKSEVKEKKVKVKKKEEKEIKAEPKKKLITDSYKKALQNYHKANFYQQNNLDYSKLFNSKAMFMISQKSMFHKVLMLKSLMS